MSKLVSTADLIEAHQQRLKQERAQELASNNVLQQNMMQNEGKLQPVHLIGPHGRYIPAYYSVEENAFLPKFTHTE